MNKRKTSLSSSTIVPSTTTTTSAKNLRLYQKSYKGGGKKDLHFTVFQRAQQFTEAKTVLYPGCHRHLTASLVFPFVTYVDYDSKIAPLYEEAAAKEYIETHKVYTQDAQYEFHCLDVLTTSPHQALVGGNYDLLVSLSAGLLAGPCTQYIREGRWLLVNDSHSDARKVFVMQRWQLKAYWDEMHCKFVTNEENLKRCFQARDNTTKHEAPLSKEQVEESIAIGTVSKRSFVVPFAPMFYLFQLGGTPEG